MALLFVVERTHNDQTHKLIGRISFLTKASQADIGKQKNILCNGLKRFLWEQPGYNQMVPFEFF